MGRRIKLVCSDRKDVSEKEFEAAVFMAKVREGKRKSELEGEQGSKSESVFASRDETVPWYYGGSGVFQRSER